MYINYNIVNGKEYGTVTSSVRKGKSVSKGKQIYLGRVIDKENGIFKNRERGLFKYDLETDSYSSVSADFEEPKDQRKTKYPKRPVLIGNDEDYETINGQPVCTDCVERYATRCDRCDTLLWSDDEYGDGDTILCASCYHNHYVRCCCCDALLHEADSYDIDGDSYCSECYRDEVDKSRSIHDYGYKPEPIFYGDDSSRYFGVELEIDGAGKDSDNADELLLIANKEHEKIYIKLDFDSLRYMSEQVQGSFTFSLLDDKNTLYLIKGSNPLCLLHFASLGLYVYASTESIMKNALKRVGLHKFGSERIEADEGDIIKIDKDGNITRSQFTPAPSYTHLSRCKWWYGDYEDYYSTYEETLVEMAHCFCVDEDDVILLLDYGYSADEVADFLMDTGTFQEAVRDVKFMTGESLYEEYCGVF